jgi:hypothetical protein
MRGVHDRSLRASDADRERVAVSLRDHAVAGRLTTDELDDRTGRALAARTRGELRALMTDLPSEATPARSVALLLSRGALTVAVGIVIVTIAILWALALAGARLARVAITAAASGIERRSTAHRSSPV